MLIFQIFSLLNYISKWFTDLYGYNELRELEDGVGYISILIYDLAQTAVVY